MSSDERFNLYTQIHKGLRACMSEVLVRVGRLDPTDTAEIRMTADAVRQMIAFARDHLHHEEELIHPVLEARRAGASSDPFTSRASTVCGWSPKTMDTGLVTH